jgi:hypothetical protein
MIGQKAFSPLYKNSFVSTNYFSIHLNNSVTLKMEAALSQECRSKSLLHGVKSTLPPKEGHCLNNSFGFASDAFP